MKIKVFLSLIIIILVVFFIYIFNFKEDKYYFNIMDKNYDYKTYNGMIKDKLDLKTYVNYVENDYRVTDLIRDIKDNKLIDNKKMQNILIKANIITLMMGNNELNYKIKNIDMTELFEYSNSLLEDIDILFNLMRKYCKEKIFFIGFYNSDDYYEEIYRYMNLRIKDICEHYDIVYIERKDIFNNKENTNIYKKIVSNI